MPLRYMEEWSRAPRIPNLDTVWR